MLAAIANDINVIQGNLEQGLAGFDDQTFNHVVLSRTLSDAGHYPAIDIEQSISRAMTSLIDQSQFDAVRRFKSMYSRYQRNRDLISVGAYAAGSDPLLDEALARYPQMEAFLQQNMGDRAGYQECVQGLRMFSGKPPVAA